MDQAEGARIRERLRASSGTSWVAQLDDQMRPILRIAHANGTRASLRVTRERSPASLADVEFIAHSHGDMGLLLDAFEGRTKPDQAKLELIAGRCEAATPGPWLVSLESDGGTGGSSVITVTHDDGEPDMYLWRGDDWTCWNTTDLASDPDYEFVATARQDIPTLLAHLKRGRTS